jgi:hypothetical protein
MYLYFSTVALPLDDKSSEKLAVPVDTDYDSIPSDKPTEAPSSDTKQPPYIFPENDEKSTSKNDTALEILQKNSNTSVINEVCD